MDTINGKKIVEVLNDILEVLNEFLSLYGDKHRTEVLLDKFAVMRKLNISESTYYRYIKRGLLRPRQIGGTDYFYERDLVEALEESYKKGKL